jgi:hypothetical protein
MKISSLRLCSGGGSIVGFSIIRSSLNKCLVCVLCKPDRQKSCLQLLSVDGANKEQLLERGDISY